MKKNRINKINWIILSDPLNEPPHYGGPLVLHYIAKKLLEFGDRVMMNHPFYEGVEKIDEKFLQKINTTEWILVLSENDFRLQSYSFKTVRLILYKPKDINKYKPDELLFQYGKSFTLGGKIENSLSIKPIVLNLNFWKDLGLERSELPIILIKKGFSNVNFETKKGRIIDDIVKMNSSREDIDFDLLKVFNKHKKFITYDNETFFSMQAALCGAISIVIPDGRLSEEEWRNVNPSRKWGIAYGDTEEQINFALNTRDKLRDFLEKEVIASEKEIEFFRNQVLLNFKNYQEI